MDSVRIFLSSAQLKKLQSGKPFQVPASQLTADDGKHHVELFLENKHYKNLLKNVHNKKGFRFSPDIVKGHGIYDKVKETAEKVKDATIKTGKLIKKYVPKEVVKAGLDAGAIALSTAIGNPELGLLATPVIHKIVDMGYDSNKSVKEHAIDEAQNYVNKHNNTHLHTGRGLKQKLKKGSPEMIAKMAHLRAMRKSKGKGIDWNPAGVDWGSVGDKIKDGFNDTIVKPIERTIVQPVESSTIQPIVQKIINPFKNLIKCIIGRRMH